MRSILIAGNWKMNNTVTESLKLLAGIQYFLENVPNGVEVVVIPPFTTLYSASISLQDTPKIKLGAWRQQRLDNCPVPVVLNAAVL